METKEAILAAIEEAYQYFITNDMVPDKHEFIERVCQIMNRGETSTYNYETMIKLVDKFAPGKIKELFEVDEASIEKDSDGYKISQSPQPSQKSPVQIGYDAVPPQPEEYQERVVDNPDDRTTDQMREPEDFNNTRSYAKKDPRKQRWIKKEEIEKESDSGKPGDGQFPGQTSDLSNEREGDTHYSYSAKENEAKVMTVINPEKENVEDWQVLKMIKTMLPFQHSREEVENIADQLKMDKEKVNVIVKDLISRHILEHGESGYALTAAHGSDMAEPSYDPLEI